MTRLIEQRNICAYAYRVSSNSRVALCGSAHALQAALVMGQQDMMSISLACAPPSVDGKIPHQISMSVDGTTPHLISTATLNSCFYPLCTNTTYICFPLNSHGSCFLFRVVVLPLRHWACTLANEMISKRVLQNAASDTQNALHSTRGTHEVTKKNCAAVCLILSWSSEWAGMLRRRAKKTRSVRPPKVDRQHNVRSEIGLCTHGTLSFTNASLVQP